MFDFKDLKDNADWGDVANRTGRASQVSLDFEIGVIDELL